MYCTQCGVELSEKDRFCSQCAHRTPLGVSESGQRTERRLSRDLDHKKIAGVCAGFARYLDMDVVLVRILWLALAIGTGIGFIAYAIAWIIMPRDPKPAVMSNPAPIRYGSA
jgi:phage shock protein C